MNTRTVPTMTTNQPPRSSFRLSMEAARLSLMNGPRNILRHMDRNCPKDSARNSISPMTMITQVRTICHF